jgi:hypothetical protein
MTVGRRVALAWLALAACSGGRARAQSGGAAAPLEASVKAAYLYKFTAFVEWPPGSFAGPQEPIVIGVVSQDAVHAELLTVLAGRTAQERPLQARRLQPGDAVDGVHMLYVGGAVAGSAQQGWLQSLQSKPLLLVTDDPAGLALGGALNFVKVGGRVRFEASLVNAQRAGVRLSARLLGVAERVVQAS